MTAAGRVAFAPRVQPPPTITKVQSYSLVIRDMFLDKLVQAQFFQGFTPRKNKSLQIMTASLPYIGVYFISEDMTPDGDLNAGEIRFTHMLKLGFSAIIINNDPVACEAKLDQAFWTIMNTLWRDPYLTNLIDTRAYPGGVGNPDNVRIEGVARGARRHVFGNAGLNNETPIGEMQYEATVKYRADYAPIITDNFLQLGVQTVPLAGDGTIPPPAEQQRVVTEYDFQALDTTPPTTPTGLTATSVSATEIDLTWVASTDDVGVTGYQVLRNGMWQTTVTTASYNDTAGLTANTTYTYQVHAVDAAGNVSGAAAVSATTTA